MKVRDIQLDAWKGAAIIAVVLIHCLAYEASSTWGLVFRQMINFPVVLFIGLAGYFSAPGASSTLPAQGAGMRVWRRARMLAIPYLLWSLVFVGLLKSGDFRDPSRLFFDDLLIGRGIGVGYFILVLLQLTLIEPVLRVKTLWSGRFLLLVMLNLASLAAYYYATLTGLKTVTTPIPFPGSFCTTWCVPYCLGMYFRLREMRGAHAIGPRVIAVAKWGALVCFILSVLEAFAWRAKCPLLAISQLKGTSFLAALSLLCFCLVQVREGVVGRPPEPTLVRCLAMIGRNSLLIFLLHMGGMTLLAGVLNRLGIHIPVVPYVFVSAGLVIAGILLFAAGCRRWVPTSVCATVGVFVPKPTGRL